MTEKWSAYRGNIMAEVVELSITPTGGSLESTGWTSEVPASYQIRRCFDGYGVRIRRLKILLVLLVAVASSAQMGRSSSLIALSGRTDRGLGGLRRNLRLCILYRCWRFSPQVQHDQNATSEFRLRQR